MLSLSGSPMYVSAPVDRIEIKPSTIVESKMKLYSVVLSFFFLFLAAFPCAQRIRAQNFTAHELMSFFVTSSGPGNGADLEGLQGADNRCKILARAVGSEGREWKAYLSTHATDGIDAVNARDRIGAGPWHNSKGELVAENIAELHSENSRLSKQVSLNELGEPVNGRGDKPNRHDILTGSNLDGTLFTGDGDGDTACENWTSSSEDGSARVGHHDRVGGGQNPTSWNSAHGSRGCSQANLQATGGDGLIYCFAVATSSN
jgi:hypothetical protein